MSAEAIRLINAAISVTTLNPITSVDDGTPEAIAADLNYEDMATTELCVMPWKFARKVDDCSALPAAPDSLEYTNAWQLPDDVLKLRTVTISGEQIDYRIAEDKVIWTARTEVPKAVYTFRAPESIWPPAFKNAFRTRLESMFLRMDDRFSEAKDRNAHADTLFARARLTHSQEEAPHPNKKYSLITARRIGSAQVRR